MDEAFHDVYRARIRQHARRYPRDDRQPEDRRAGPPRRRRAGPAVPAHATPATPAGRRPVYFGGWIDTPIYDRAALRPGHTFDGPAILEQADTTSVIEPGMAARVDGFGNILVEMA